MRDRAAGRAALVIALCFAWRAEADDPCLAARATGNTMIDLANLMDQQRRAQECATLRQAQWAAYNARQKSPPSMQSVAAPGRQAPQEDYESKIRGAVPVPPNPQALSGNAPQAALQIMTGALGALREFRGMYAAPPKPRLAQP